MVSFQNLSAVATAPTRIEYMPMPLAPESATGHRFLDQHFHGERRAGDQLLDGTSRDAADAVGLAPVEAESELVEVGLQVLWLHRTGMRVKRRAKLTPYRRPILTPRSREVAAG